MKFLSKNFNGYLLLGVIIIASTLISPNFVSAQNPDDYVPIELDGSPGLIPTPGDPDSAPTQAEISRGVQRAAVNATQVATNAAKESPGACWSVLGGLKLKNCVNNVIYFVGDIVAGLLMIFLYLVNQVFNLAIYLSVYNFSEYANGNGVIKAWRIGRDVANMLFIFILLYIGIGHMLQLRQVDAKKMVVRLVFIALLLNFSAVLPKVVIDASNLLALQFYEQMGDGETWGGMPDITKAMVTRLGIFSEPSGKSQFLENYGGNNMPQLPAHGDAVSGAIISVFGKIVMIVVTAFILAAGAFMFIKRSIILLFLIIISPLAVFSVTFSESHFKRWWKTLVNESIYAPAYLFMMYLSLEVAKGTDWTHNISTDGGSFNTGPIFVFINFAIIIGLMWAALIVASRMGASGSNTADRWGGKLKGFGMGLVTGAVGGAAANTVGRAARTASNSDFVRNLNTSRLGRIAGVPIQSALQRVGNSRFGSQSSYQDRVTRQAQGIQRVGGSPVNQATYIASLRNQEAQMTAFRQLPAERQAEILDNPALPPAVQAQMAAIHGRLSPREQEAVEGGRRRIEQGNQQRQEREDINQAINVLQPPGGGAPAGTPAEIEAAVRRLRGNRAVERLTPATLTTMNVTQHLDQLQLQAIYNSSLLTPADRGIIRNHFEAIHLSGGATQEQERVYRWLNTTPAGQLF